MKIQDPEYVLRLWASAVRPSVKRAAPNGLERQGDGDDRRLQARVKVETCPSFFTVKPILWVWYVVESQSTLRDATVVASFKAELAVELAASPIIVSEFDEVPTDFEVTIGQAVDMLAGAGTPVTERTILRWIKDGLILSREQGRFRYVRWSQVLERAPRRRTRAA